MKKNFEYYLDQIINNSNEKKFVIILGSGIHKQAFQGKENINNILSSWCCLLRTIDPNIILTNNFLLDFEKIILKKN
jgi:hypothetical protein